MLYTAAIENPDAPLLGIRFGQAVRVQLKEAEVQEVHRPLNEEGPDRYVMAGRCSEEK